MKTRKRFDSQRWANNQLPDGEFTLGIWNLFNEALAHMVVTSSEVELVMMKVFAALIGDEGGDIAQPIWVSIRSNAARRSLMEKLLQDHPRNQHLSQEADEIIADFERFRVDRNRFVHGLWVAEERSFKQYLIPRLEPNGDAWEMQKAEEVKVEDVELSLHRAQRLSDRAEQWHRKWKASLSRVGG